MTDLRQAAQQALEAIDQYLHCCFEKETDIQRDPFSKAMDDSRAALRAALAEPDEDDALTAAYMLGRHASLEAQNAELDRKLAEIERGAEPAAMLTTWVSETEAVTEPLYKSPRRLTDTEVGEVWFAARIPGLTETDARRLIRAAEQRAGVSDA